jgi:predicted acylesterase/phospholipase RssA
VLAACEAQSGARLLDHFDLIAGTSTGGILALGIAAGISAADLRDFYLSDGPRIFPPLGGVRRVGRLLASVVRPKHSQEPLAAALKRVFGDRTMWSLRTRVVIPAFNATAGRIRLFKTRHHERLTRDHTRTLVEVALATSAAPYFLPGLTTADSERYVDGGIWANNPIAVGVIEAVGYLGIPPGIIRVLSVGTTAEPFHVEGGTIGRGLAGIALGALRGQSVGLVMAGQMTGAHAQAKTLLGREQSILRIDPPVARGRFALDRTADLAELRGLGEDAGTRAMPRVRAIFLDAPAAYPYAPVPLP